MACAIRLRPDELLRRCDPEQFDFATTADLEPLTEPVGQPRAMEAVQLAAGMGGDGYNLFALGPAGSGKRSAVRCYLQAHAAAEPVPDDWCYVFNFAVPEQPQAIRLPNGLGTRLRADMEALVADLRSALPAVFDGADYSWRVRQLQDDFRQRRELAFAKLAEDAERSGVQFLRTPSEFGFAPQRAGDAVDQTRFETPANQQQRDIEQALARLQARLNELLAQLPHWQRETQAQIEALRRRLAQLAVQKFVDELRRAYAGFETVVTFLDRVQADTVENAARFLVDGAPLSPAFLRRYQVKVMVDHGASQGAPVVYEDTPRLANLVGSIGQRSEMGVLSADFTLIRSGALHRANGGYLLLDAHKLLAEPESWEALKRALQAREVRIEFPHSIGSAALTAALEPEPIPLNVKVVLLGERVLYYLLWDYDPDFEALFKVAADFDNDMEWSAEGLRLYARLIGDLARRHDLRALDRDAVARVVEYAARLSEDTERITVHLQTISDLLREADYWARARAAAHVQRVDVQKAIDAQIRRMDRVRERSYEEVHRGIVSIDTEGSRVGQVNGISVIELGGFAFGQPSKISATAGLGEGDIVDIERETELGGALHSKGVLILSAYLASRYCADKPLSLAASVVFEQSYASIEGDSASAAELCALLSALAQAPLRQDLGVTGAVNQCGEVQAIGGVNEKIEGFYDICAARDLNARQGVLIPRANVAHLMLREDVVQAVADGRFAVYAVYHIDQAMELLTGVVAGQADDQDGFPDDSINRRVSDRLADWADIRHEFSKPAPEGAEDGAEGDESGL